MARRKYSAPRRGSLGVRPRKRAAMFIPRVRSWPEVDFAEPKPLAFLGYKAGMTHVIMIDDRPGTRTYGQEVHVPVTVIETPPMIALAARFYIPTVAGLKCLTEVWTEPPEELQVWRRVKTLSISEEHKKKALSILEAHKNEIARVSLLFASQPRAAGGLSKKVPDIIEVKVSGGSTEKQMEYALNALGREIKVNDVFSAGQFIDVIGVTKGKGFQGVIKRFGVKELPRWHKHRKGSRRIGSRSPTAGALSTVPQPGQMGFHRRTELNKRILMMGSDGHSITPSGGFPHYGIVRSDFIVVKGSIQGPPKRPLVLRWPVRPPAWLPEEPPKILYVSLESKI
ncbi:MAG: 50S ribosomal protein L3 [Desulfurococcales archaeon]|nr:50S ribosomal protein L3 [Desulfurococcales archaeon]